MTLNSSRDLVNTFITLNDNSVILEVSGQDKSAFNAGLVVVKRLSINLDDY